MNVTQMLAELRQERAALDDAILALERIARSGARGRGRPPSWLSASSAAPKRVLSAATKKKMALAQRKRWAEYRKQQQQQKEG